MMLLSNIVRINLQNENTAFQPKQNKAKQTNKKSRPNITAFTMIMGSLKGNEILSLNLIITILFVGIAHMLYIPYC